MWIRILTAVVALAVFIPCLLFAPNWVVILLFGLLAAIAVYEVAGCTGLKKEYWLTVCSMLLVFLSVVKEAIAYTMYNTDYIAKPYDPILYKLSAASGALLVLLYIIAGVVRHEKLPAEKLCLQGFFCLYIQYAFGVMSSFADYYRSTLWITLCIPWVADTLAYFVGRFCGKRKLCPNISPKKTVEGAVGGVLGTGVVAVLVYGFAVKWEVLPLLIAFFGAMLLAIVSIFGDLFASVVKRRFDVKDYGKLFPGHGGVLDRFDSTLAVAVAMNIIWFSGVMDFLW